jgi:ferritin-like metal-binding protein YciE
MEKIINLKDLLRHEILDLYSAEEQLLDSLPDMTEKATKVELKEALTNYKTQIIRHKEALDKIKMSMQEADKTEKDRGFFSALFGGSDKVTSKGIEGLLKECNKLMAEEMTPEAMDASIIGSLQKIIHYKIAGYGTTKAYASELKMESVSIELIKSLDEEYQTDKALSVLALGAINADAEKAVDNEETRKEALEDDLNFLSNSVSIMNSSDDD